MEPAAGARLRIVKPPLLTGICLCAGCQTMGASGFSTSPDHPESEEPMKDYAEGARPSI